MNCGLLENQTINVTICQNFSIFTLQAFHNLRDKMSSHSLKRNYALTAIKNQRLINLNVSNFKID